MPAQAGLFEGGPLGPYYLWAIQTSEALNWKVIVQQPFRKVRHINLQEGSVEGLVVRRAPWRRRILILEDSEVTLGSSAKGRSPSRAMNRLLLQRNVEMLAREQFLRGTHIPTWSIRADYPSRFNPLVGPRTVIPRWMRMLRAGDREGAIAVLDTLGAIPRGLAWWLRLLLSLVGRIAGLPRWRWCAPAAASRDTGPSCDSGRPCVGPGSLETRKVVGGVRGVAGEQKCAVQHEAHGDLPGSTAGGVPARVWFRALRSAPIARHIRGHYPSGGGPLRMDAASSCGRVEGGRQMEPARARLDPPALANQRLGSDRLHSSGVELDVNSWPLADRILGYAEANRVACMRVGGLVDAAPARGKRHRAAGAKFEKSRQGPQRGIREDRPPTRRAVLDAMVVFNEDEWAHLELVAESVRSEIAGAIGAPRIPKKLYRRLVENGGSHGEFPLVGRGSGESNVEGALVNASNAPALHTGVAVPEGPRAN
jgi:hypothetical protein